MHMDVWIMYVCRIGEMSHIVLLSSRQRESEGEFILPVYVSS